MMIKVTNPILNGFFPDPSICRVGEDFYIVNSSFSYFPGVPIWQSKDLANWKQIGNVLDRNSQIPLTGCEHSQGIFAPTIRYYEGTYYMITTNVSAGGNFIVTATNPVGPWSEPYLLGEDASGIDPSLFFDEDGTCYYIGTRPNPEGVRYNGDWEIYVQELDLTTMKLVGESHYVWKGALKDVIWPEGPHLYRKDDYYYIMNAEGGTGPNHAVTIARSKNIFGPYENNPNNPILTHRHLGKEYPIIYVGHGDLVDDLNGNWYMVVLASRRCEGYVGLGRETFLAKVVWEDGWPIVNPGIGKLEDVVELPFEGVSPKPVRYQTLMDSNKDMFDVVVLRNSDLDFFHRSQGELSVDVSPYTLKELKSPALLGLRQLEYKYEVSMEFAFRPNEEEEAGFVILQSNEYYIQFCLKKVASNEVVQVVECTAGQEQILAEKELELSDYTEKEMASIIRLKINTINHRATFTLCGADKEIVILSDADIHEMSTEVAGGFVGNILGAYASSNGKETENKIKIYDFKVVYKS
jgi:alpha-N-arabinofuranosidase